MKTAAALLFSCSLFAARAYAQCTGCFHPSFGPISRAFPVNFATHFVSGDFDADGVADIVVTVGNGIAFLRGSGSGTFAAPVVSYAATLTDWIVAADFNGDGLLDVATTSDGVAIFLGNGDGSFQAPIETVPDAYGSTWLSTADFNGDGIPDLATNAFSLGRPRIYLGNGDGTLQPPIELDVLFGSFLTTADFNADGRADVAVAAVDGIYVFLGDGHGGFSAPLPPTGLGNVTFAVADVDADGIPDLLEDDFDDVQVRLGNGDGTFRDGQILAAGPGPNAIATGDFDLDGTLDVVVAVYQSLNVLVFHGLGGGTFGPADVTPASGEISEILVGDLDANGRLDIAGLQVNFGFETLLARADGSFPHPVLYPTGGTSDVGQQLSIAIADLTGDGFNDVAVSNLTSQTIGILAGDGGGNLQAPITVPTLGVPRGIATGLFDAGNLTDMAVVTDTGIQVFLSQGAGSFQALPPFGPPSQAIVTGDFNSDGKTDLAVGGNLSIWLGNGDGTFSAGPSAPGGVSGDSLTVAYFNGDAVPDLAVNGGNVTYVLLGNGDGSFTVSSTISFAGNAVGGAAIGDFDADGKTDIAVARSNGDVTTFIDVYWGKGDGTFDAPTTISGNFGFGGFGMFAADVTGEGLPDILLGGTNVFRSRGDRTFELSLWVSPSQFGWFAAGDLNGDGKRDLAFIGGFPVQSAVLLNTICVPSKLVIATEPSSCNASGVPFGTQPSISVVDGGDNLMTCDDGTVVRAAIRPGTGAPGAVLRGQTIVPTGAGTVTFTNLSIDRPGRGYVLTFTHPAVGMTISRTLSQDLTAVLSGPATICNLAEGTYRTAGGYDRYQWLLDGAPISRADTVTLSGMAIGPHTLDVTVFEDGCTASDAAAITVLESPPQPSIIAPLSVRVGATGIVASATAGANSYAWLITGGTITSGQGTNQITFDAGPPGTTITLGVIASAGSGCAAPEAFGLVQVDFADAGSGPFREDIDTVARNRITAGCETGLYCPDAPVTRAQMAVFLLKGEHGPYFVPPPANGEFEDVPPGSFAADWIEQLHLEGITAGCDATHYCPDDPVTRAQMAVFLLKTEHGATFVPPSCAGIFDDVECEPDPAFAVDWIERLFGEGVTAGCSLVPALYCPDAAVNREQMATFLVRTLNLH